MELSVGKGQLGYVVVSLKIITTGGLVVLQHHKVMHFPQKAE